MVRGHTLSFARKSLCRYVARIASTCCVALALIATDAATAAHANNRSAAFVLDATTGRVLFSRSGDARRFPASLTKIMTLYLVFEDIENGRIKPDTMLRVSSRAAAQEPSKLWLSPGDSISVADAIRALITRSANDVAVVVAEGLADSESAFAERMTKTAHALGMKATRFRNASGLPDDAQYTTARDMARLGAAIQVRFPDQYRLFRTRSFTFRGETYVNHNRLLNPARGIDGIKTGFIRASGFNIVASRRAQGRKIIVVVMGGSTGKVRNDRAAALLNSHLANARAGDGYYQGLMAAVSNASPTEKVAAHPPLPPPRPDDDDAETAQTTAQAAVPTRTAQAATPAEAPAQTVTLPLPPPRPGTVAIRTASTEPATPDIAAETATAPVASEAAEAFASARPARARPAIDRRMAMEHFVPVRPAAAARSRMPER